MENFVLLKDSYDSLTFDSYDLIPTLETVYGKQNSCFYQVSEEKTEYQTHKIYSQREGTHPSFHISIFIMVSLKEKKALESKYMACFMIRDD